MLHLSQAPLYSKASERLKEKHELILVHEDFKARQHFVVVSFNKNTPMKTELKPFNKNLSD